MPDDTTATGDDEGHLFDQTNGVLGADPDADEHQGEGGTDAEDGSDESFDLMERGAASNIASGGGL